MRTRMKAARFVITPPDINHDYWHLMFAEEDLTSDVIIEIEDMTKFKEELDKWVVAVPPKELAEKTLDEIKQLLRNAPIPPEEIPDMITKILLVNEVP